MTRIIIAIGFIQEYVVLLVIFILGEFDVFANKSEINVPLMNKAINRSKYFCLISQYFLIKTVRDIIIKSYFNGMLYQSTYRQQ